MSVYFIETTTINLDATIHGSSEHEDIATQQNISEKKKEEIEENLGQVGTVQKNSFYSTSFL